MTATARRFDSFEQAFALSFAQEKIGETCFLVLSKAEILQPKRPMVSTLAGKRDPDDADLAQVGGVPAA